MFCPVALARDTQGKCRLLDRAKQLYQRCLKNDSFDAVLAFVVEQLEVKPERADVVHDLLAFLAERMMALNRDKHAVAEQFLADLNDFHSIDGHALNPKTKLDTFWKLQAAELFAHLRKNAKTLADKGVRLKESDEDKIHSRFLKAQEKIVPLETQIAFTDRLIDQIVYRLYGLTEDEIQIVEGKQSG